MDEPGVARRVRMYLSEGDSWRHQPTYVAVLDLLRREGCAGASVFKGVAGFGAHGQIHTAVLVDVTAPLPVVVEWVDTPERVERLLPKLTEMTEGLVTVEEARVAQQPRRKLRDVPSRALVRDVMTPADQVDAATPETGLRDLVLLLLRKRRNAIPVIDHDRRVVGIITNRDLVERAGLPLRLELLRALGDPDQPEVAAHLTGLHGEGHTAASIMISDVVTVGPDVPVVDAADLMLNRRLKRLPVVDAEGRLLGMVSRFDVLKTVANGYPHPREVAPPPGVGAATPRRRISEVMNPDVPTVALDAPLPEVLEAVMATRLHRAVVVDDGGTPVGIVVDTDLMQRVTPTAHPGLVEALMRRVRPVPRARRDEWQQRTGQRAEDVMRPLDRMLIVPADSAVADVIDQSLAQQVKLVAVIDQQGKLVGMADRADLLGALAAGV